LEEIRLLTNLETASEKLLQIVLAGQPELSVKLNSPDLRQLKQRIGLRCNLDPLTMEETREYIDTRLEIAGLSQQQIFSEPTIAEIYRLSGGIPRLINTICDNSLLNAYASDSKTVGMDIIQEVSGDLELSHLPRYPLRSIQDYQGRGAPKNGGSHHQEADDESVSQPLEKMRYDSESFNLFVQFVDKLRHHSQ
jgi:hypothetical protein